MFHFALAERLVKKMAQKYGFEAIKSLPGLPENHLYIIINGCGSASPSYELRSGTPLKIA
jgi:hypothetical protein